MSLAKKRSLLVQGEQSEEGVVSANLVSTELCVLIWPRGVACTLIWSPRNCGCYSGLFASNMIRKSANWWAQSWALSSCTCCMYSLQQRSAQYSLKAGFRKLVDWLFNVPATYTVHHRDGPAQTETTAAN